MSTSKNAKMMVETGQSYTDYTAMTNSGDNTVFTVPGGSVLSGRSGFEAVVRPNGVVTGRNMLSTHATDNTVTVAAFTANSEGTVHSVSATTAVITRPATNVAKVNSITMTDAGAIAVVAGTDGSTAAFSSTRGAAGGPPEIPADSVEIGQVRVTTSTADAIDSTEIFQVPGTHTERADLPTYTLNNIGDGDAADEPAKENAYLEFADALPEIHASATAKKVYIAFYTPIFAQIQRAMDFVPAENTHSVSSTQYYDGTVASSSASLGQASFTALMDDNITDTIVGLRDEILTFKFFPDKNKTPYIITQGVMGMSRSFPVSDQNQASITISAESKSADFSG